MEVICKRFPGVSQIILKNLDDQSLERSKEASRGISKFLENERFPWIRIISRRKGNFQGFEESWKQFINKTPTTLVKKLGLAVQQSKKCFDEYPYLKQIAPLHIAAEKGILELCELIFAKTSNISPVDDRGETPLHKAAICGHLDVCDFLVEMMKVNFSPYSSFI